MIHSLSKEVTASCAFLRWEFGIPSVHAVRAVSQASLLAYKISQGVNGKTLHDP